MMTRWIQSAAVLTVLTATVFPVKAQDADGAPGAPLLLPTDTMAYLRISDVDELREGFDATSMGRMLADPKMKPFASEFYATLQELFGQVSQVIGVELDELLSIPSGQVSVALVPRLLAEPDPDQETRDDDDDDSEEAIKRRLDRKRRQANGFAGVFIVDAGENVETLMTLVEKLEGRMKRDRMIRRVEKIDGTSLIRWLPPRQGRHPVEYFQKDGTVVFGIGNDTAAASLRRWTGEDTDATFANSSDFASVMSRSVGAEETLPQVTFFVDPYKIIERLVKGNGGGAALAWPLIEKLGISKIRGIGGSAFRGGEVFDDISHIHVVIDPPRDGLFGVLRPGTGDTVPPTWVPADVMRYGTVHWRLDKTLENLGKILDTFNGEGSIDRLMEQPMQKRLGISLREDLIANLTGRYVSVGWLEPPMRINSQTTVVALEVKDAGEAKKLLDQFRERVPQALKPEVIAGTMTYVANRPNNAQLPATLRQPQPRVFQIDDWVIYCDSDAMVSRIIQANGGGLPRLAGEPDYQLVSAELGGKLAGENPFMVSYVKAADVYRQFFEMAKTPETKNQLRQWGENNVVARKFAELLDNNELPDFSELSQYFGPGGIFGYDEPNGIHIGMFNLKPL